MSFMAIEQSSPKEIPFQVIKMPDRVMATIDRKYSANGMKTHTKDVFDVLA